MVRGVEIVRVVVRGLEAGGFELKYFGYIFLTCPVLLVNL